MYQIAIVTTRISSPAKGKIIGAPAMAKVMAMTKIGNETKNKNGQKQKLYVAVVCEGRVFNSTDDEMKWGEWSEPKNIFESRIVADVCNFI